ncbi:MAG: class I SAM-dependent methyltransferase, partial [Rhodospirillales bacterium]|nr:class I SAM-dependent methyltransferase [Acetobacter sp.]
MAANHQYAAKHDDYFGMERSEIFPLLPAVCHDVLEIGCGNGGTMAWLRTKRDLHRAVGMELMPEQAVEARHSFDEVITGNIEQQELPTGRFHLILALDVLEHLVDPWGMIQRLHKVLRPGGSLLVSLPHVGHYSVALRLMLLNHWTYQSDGLLDRTHLRFFTRKSAVELVTCSGLHLSGFRPQRPVHRGLAFSQSSRWYLRRILEELP